MKIQILEDTTNYEVHLIHPDYGSEFHWISVADDGNILKTDEEYKEYIRELFKVLKERYNPYGYWHEMTVTAEFMIDGKEYRKVIEEVE